MNLNKPLVDLDGKDTQLIGSKVLAQLLASAQCGDPEKWWDWAQALQAGKEIQVNDQEKAELIKFVSEHGVLTVAGKAQLLRWIKG